MKRIYIIGLLILVSIAGYTQDRKTIDWKGDIEYLKNELPLRHKNLFFHMSKSDYEKSLDNISSHLDQLNDFEVAVKIQQLIARIGDSHTNAGVAKFLYNEMILPVQLYWFSDGIYILQAAGDYQKLPGARIIKINGYAIQSVADSLSTLITIDNQALVKNNIPGLIPFVQLLRYFGFVKEGSVEFEVQTADGQTLNCEIRPGNVNRNNIISFKPDSVAFCWRNQRSVFLDKYFTNDSIYYLQYNKCTSKELEEMQGNQGTVSSLPSFAAFENRVFDVIQNKPVNKFIFDMRFNGGGNSSQGTEFISKLSGYDISKQDKKLYVITGRRTFSSAIINTMDFKKLTKAIIVGEETGGKPNHFGEVRSFQLPSSGLPINYSTKYFTRTKEDLKTITPDIIIETSFSDYRRGIDPVYEWIRKQ